MERINVTIVSSHRDLSVQRNFFTELQFVVKSTPVSIWSDDKIGLGEDWDKETTKKIFKSDLIILILSHDFFCDFNCIEILDKIKSAVKVRKIKIISIYYKNTILSDDLINSNLIFPDRFKSISEVENRNKAITDTTMKIYEVIQKIMKTHELEDDRKYKRSILQLKNNLNGKIKDLLSASPFDSEKNIDGAFSEELFYDVFFCKERVLIDYQEKLYSVIIDSFYRNSRVIFINGYCGTGKTTFLKSFIREYEAFNHLYFDAQDVLFNGQVGGRGGISDKEIIFKLMSGFEKDYDKLMDTYRFILDNLTALKEDKFISVRFWNKLRKNIKKIIDKNFIEECIENFDFKDAYTCFFIHYFRHSDRNKIKLFYFDNLDIINLDFLAGKLVRRFDEGISNARKLADSHLFRDKEINFVAQYKFIFCLRDGNEARLNSHLLSRRNIRAFSFKLLFNHEYLKNILEKRMSFVMGNFTDSELVSYPHITLSAVDKWTNRLLNDDYYKNVFLPLYNFDYRSSVSVLLDIVVECSRPENNIDSKDSDHLSFGFRGLLLFKLLAKMRDNDFIRDFPNDKTENKPSCNPDRLALTLILNNSNFSPLDFSKNEAISLSKLIQNAHPVLSEKALKKSISRLFLYHKKDWVNLVTITNYEVINIESLDNITSNQAAEINVMINPSGYSYVKYILPHFEFFSNIIGNNKSLFLTGLTKRSNKKEQKDVYYFDIFIEKVYNLVVNHVKSMTLFYTINVHSSDNNNFNTPLNYIESDFTFKHLGKSGFPPKTSGFFHSTRIITSHIDYIQKFRIFLFRKNLHLGEDDIIKINEVILNHVRNYKNLLSNTVDIRAKEELLPHFDKIIDNLYLDLTDTTTYIEIPKEDLMM